MDISYLRVKLAFHGSRLGGQCRNWCGRCRGLLGLAKRSVFAGFDKHAVCRGTFPSAVTTRQDVKSQEMIAHFAVGNDDIFCSNRNAECPPDADSWMELAWRPCDPAITVQTGENSAGCFCDSQLRNMSSIAKDHVVGMILLVVDTQCLPSFYLDPLADPLCVPCQPGECTCEVDMTRGRHCAPGDYNDFVDASACTICIQAPPPFRTQSPAPNAMPASTTEVQLPTNAASAPRAATGRSRSLASAPGAEVARAPAHVG